MEGQNQVTTGAGAMAGGWSVQSADIGNDCAGPSTLVKADPIVPHHERTASFDGGNDVRGSSDMRTTWEWISDKDQSKSIGDMYARSRMEGTVRVLYIGRPNGIGGYTTVRMSMFQAVRLRAVVEAVLEQVEVYGQLENNKLIPFFGGSYRRAFEAPRKNNLVSFWDTADLDLGTLKARVSFDTHAGFYKLRILSPVDNAAEKFQGAWLGPVLTFNFEEMKKLRAFITALRQADA